MTIDDVTRIISASARELLMYSEFTVGGGGGGGGGGRGGGGALIYDEESVGNGCGGGDGVAAGVVGVVEIGDHVVARSLCVGFP